MLLWQMWWQHLDKSPKNSPKKMKMFQAWHVELCSGQFKMCRPSYIGNPGTHYSLLNLCHFTWQSGVIVKVIVAKFWPTWPANGQRVPILAGWALVLVNSKHTWRVLTPCWLMPANMIKVYYPDLLKSLPNTGGTTLEVNWICFSRAAALIDRPVAPFWDK